MSSRPEAPKYVPSSREVIIDRLRVHSEATDELEFVGVSPVFLNGVKPDKPLPFSPQTIWEQIAYLTAKSVYEPGANWKAVSDVLNLRGLTEGLGGTQVLLRGSGQQKDGGLHLGVVTIKMSNEIRYRLPAGRHLRGDSDILAALASSGVELRTKAYPIPLGGTFYIHLFPTLQMAQQAFEADTAANAPTFGTYISSRSVV